MNTNGPLGSGKAIVLVILAGGALLCGVHAILADSVTTPARFGGDHRVYGADTILVGVGWILMGFSIMGKIALWARRSGSVIAVVLAVIGGLFWLAAV